MPDDRVARLAAAEAATVKALSLAPERAPTLTFGLALVFDEGGGERPRKPNPEHDRQPRIWFSKVARWPTSFLRAVIREWRA
jgi:hypothetical protein